MAGFTIIPTNRVLTATITKKVGTTAAAYPVSNLLDPAPWLYTQIAAASNNVRILFDLGAAPSGTSNTDWAISGCGIVNCNALDGMTVTLKRHTADDYAAATQVFSYEYDANMGQPNILKTFTAAVARYWFLDFSHASALTDPVKVGAVILGPAFDLGYPAWGQQVDYAPRGTSVQSQTGYIVAGRGETPVETKRYRFEDASTVIDTLTYSPTVANATTYPTYQTLERHWRQDRHFVQDAGASTYSGQSVAGGARPIVYHRGDVYGISTGGRPAFYGVASATFTELIERNRCAVDLTITDICPQGMAVKPPTN